MKVATFTVHATAEQSVRWKRAAEAEGHRSAGTWLAAADAYLRVRARAGQPLPLAWHLGAFTARMMDGREIQVRGVVSPPFGVFQGNSHGPDGNKLRTLVHLPTSRVIATLKSSRQCRALVAELAPVLLRGELPHAAPIVARPGRYAVSGAGPVPRGTGPPSVSQPHAYGQVPPFLLGCTKRR